MKKNQRFLAFLTSIGLMLTMSGCRDKNGDKSQKDPFLTDHYEDPLVLEEVSLKELVEKINLGGKYEVKVYDNDMIIDEKDVSGTVDYTLFRKIIEVANIRYVTIGYSNHDLKLSSLLSGFKGIDVSIYEAKSLSNLQRKELSKEIALTDAKIKYVIYSGTVDESLIDIVNAIGKKNGSLDIRCSSNNIKPNDIFAKIDPECHFYEVYLFTGEKNISQVIDRVNAKSVRIYADFQHIDSFTLSKNVEELYILDDYRPGDAVIFPCEVDINIEEGSALKTCQIDGISRLILIKLSDPSIDQTINVTSKECASFYIDNGILENINTTFNIEEDSSSLVITDGVDYYRFDEDNMAHFEKEDFSKETLYISTLPKENTYSSKVK